MNRRCGKICFLSTHSSGKLQISTLFCIHSQIYFFDFSNNQGTFWTPGDDDDYLIFQINNK